MTLSNQFATNLRYLCSRLKSVSVACRSLGFNRQQFARYLSGETKPSHYNLQRIAQGFGVSVEDILNKNLAESLSVPSKEVSPILNLLCNAFPGDIKSLRPLLGYYHMNFLVPYRQGKITRSLIHLYEYDGMVCSKTIERVLEGGNVEIPHLSKYNGLASYLGGCIFLIEFQNLSRDSIAETMLYPPYRRKLDILTGLTFGVTSEVHRRPFASPVAWKYLGQTINIREQISACGSYSINDGRIDPRIRKYLQSGGIANTISSTPI